MATHYPYRPTAMVRPPEITKFHQIFGEDLSELVCPPSDKHTVGWVWDDNSGDWVPYRWSGTSWVRWQRWDPDVDRHTFCSINDDLDTPVGGLTL